MSAFAAEDEAAKFVETSKARREAWKVFREKVSMGNLCEPRNYRCFNDAAMKIPGIHPEDLIASRSFLEPYYLRSIKDDTLPCGESCQHNLRASNIRLFLALFLGYKAGHEEIYNFSDSTTVRATLVRAYMDLSAFKNMKKHMEYVKSEYAKLDISKVTNQVLKSKDWYENAIATVESGKLFSHSILCHLHPGSLVYDDIAKGKSKVDAKYSGWLKEFEETGRMACVDSTPIEYRGMDLSTRKYYEQQTVNKINAINCKHGDYACVRKEFRNITVHYADDLERIIKFLFAFYQKSTPAVCDETCKAQNLLRATQTLITFLGQYDRQKLASTMDWKKYPEEKYKTLTEDVMMLGSLEGPFTFILETLANLDSAKIKDEGLRSELKSISKDVSDFASGKMLKDSVICTMEPWTAAYDKYMTPYKKPKRNKEFEKGFLHFKEKVCK